MKSPSKKQVVEALRHEKRTLGSNKIKYVDSALMEDGTMFLVYQRTSAVETLLKKRLVERRFVIVRPDGFHDAAGRLAYWWESGGVNGWH